LLSLNINLSLNNLRERILLSVKCRSAPEVLSDAKFRLHGAWQWASGDFSSGNSIAEEVDS
jgi:hypothetical protein